MTAVRFWGNTEEEGAPAVSIKHVSVGGHSAPQHQHQHRRTENNNIIYYYCQALSILATVYRVSNAMFFR